MSGVIRDIARNRFLYMQSLLKGVKLHIFTASIGLYFGGGGGLNSKFFKIKSLNRIAILFKHLIKKFE